MPSDLEDDSMIMLSVCLPLDEADFNPGDISVRLLKNIRNMNVWLDYSDFLASHASNQAWISSKLRVLI